MINRVLEIMEENRIRETENFRFLASLEKELDEEIFLYELEQELEDIIQEFIEEEALGQ